MTYLFISQNFINPSQSNTTSTMIQIITTYSFKLMLTTVPTQTQLGEHYRSWSLKKWLQEKTTEMVDAVAK